MSAQTTETLGLILVHFLWEGAALAFILWAIVAGTRDPRARYAAAVSTLGLMAVCAVATLVLLNRPAATSVSLESPMTASALSNVGVALHTAPPLTAFDWLNCLVWIWFGGVALFGMRAFGGWVLLQRLRRAARETIRPELLERCRSLQKRIGVAKLVRYAHSEMVDAPAVVGWLRPVVLIPLSAIAGLSVEQVDAIVAHELAHIKRYDGLVNLFQIAMETLLFYHPAIWWVNRVIRRERENCCDDAAVAVCGNAREYAHALAMLSAAATRPVWAMSATGGALKGRISRLLGLQKISHGVPRAGLAGLAVLCGSCVLLAAGVFKQDAPLPLAPQAHVEVPAAPEPPAEAAPTVALATPHSPLPRPAPLAPNAPSEEPPLPPEPPAEEHDGGSYIDSLESVGLKHLTVDELISLKIQGVTAEYVRGIRAAGLDPNMRNLIEMKIQGVTPEYVRNIQAAGLKPGVRDVIEMKIQSVTPEFVRALQTAGIGDLRMRDFVSAKIQGVTPEFIEKVRSHGFKDLTFRQLMNLKIAGIF